MTPEINHITNLINLLTAHKKECQSHDCGVSIYFGKQLAYQLITHSATTEDHKVELKRLVDNIGS